MSSLAQNPPVNPHSETAQDTSPFFTVWLVRAMARVVNAHGWIVFALVSVVCGRIAMNTLASRPLDHDELYTFYIAQAPTLKGLVGLTQSVDLHPPLSYLLVRASFAIFGVSSWSCRLPYALAFVATGALLFWLARQILSPLYGIVAVLFLWSIPFTYQADEARPYSLLLCFTAAMLASWHQAIQGEDCDSQLHDRRLPLLALTSSGFSLLLSHIFGVLPFAAFFAAELVRLWIRRKPDWKLWAALLIPAISGMTYLPLIHAHSGITFTTAYRPTPMRLLAFYVWTLRYLTIPLVLVALLAFLLPLLRQKCFRSQCQELPAPPVLLPMAVLLCSFTLVPLAVALLFIHTGSAFFFRYGIVACIPVALVPALLLGFRTRRSQMAAMAAILALSTTMFFNTSGRVWLIEQLASLAPPTASRYVLNALALPIILDTQVKAKVPAVLQGPLAAALPISNLDDVRPDLPLVANTGLTFLEVDQRADAELAHRLYLLNDRQFASSITRDTVFENYGRLTNVFPIRGKVDPYCDFVSQHPRFLALGDYSHPQGWLLKKLYAEGADLRILGTYPGLTEDAALYEVTVLKAGCPALP
jgi:4-amino-4-deoxy-L-arabinose transferase-like glycosyltransferase